MNKLLLRVLLLVAITLVMSLSLVRTEVTPTPEAVEAGAWNVDAPAFPLVPMDLTMR